MTFNNNTELLMYQTEDGKTKIEVRMEDETVWLSLNQMAELFQRDKSVISRHIKNIFSEGELDEKSVVANFATTAADGKMLIKHQLTIMIPEIKTDKTAKIS